MRCCKDVQIFRCSDSLRKTNNTQDYIYYIKQYAETRQEEGEGNEEEEEEEEEMSCFPKDRFRLKDGKVDLNSVWFLFLNFALYYTRLSSQGCLSINTIDL